jgi:hypothetical protein
MKVHIVTEGKTDVAWLRWLLAPEVTEYNVRFYAGGKSGAISMARTIVGVQLEPVILVEDSDTTDPGKIADLEKVIRSLLGMAAPQSMWRLCLAVPVIESWILSARPLKELFGVALSSREKSRLQQKPKEAMAQLFQQAQTTYTGEAIQEVTENKDASHLREHESVRAIRDYIEELAALSSPALR